MRRFLLLLALVPAGIGGARGAPTVEIGGGPYEIEARDGLEPAAFLRPGTPQLFPVGQDDSGPSPRPLVRRPGSPGLRPGLPLPPDGRAAAFQARHTDHRQFAARLAMQRAGRIGFPTTAPPPFTLV